jgi:nucleoside 2-deoxyribosyltransferase
MGFNFGDQKEQFQNQLLILKGLALNNQWFEDKNRVIEVRDLLSLINTSNHPKSPVEKVQNLLKHIYKRQSVEGEEISFNDIFDADYVNSLFFKNTEECNFYMGVLEDDGLITMQRNSDKICLEYTITYKGLNAIIHLLENGKDSKNCFIAMSFGSEMIEIRTAIKEAVIQTGYKPILIDEINVDSEVTINDGIIASIKNSKFCIADFTEQKDGVYFEAGYALGRGLKVIYTCQKTDFENSHFDTNHFPHIIYETVEELREKLIKKIEAWVKD